MNQEKIGKFIAKSRKDKKMTQEQLADILGVTSKSISRWERGICMPDLSLYEKLCNTLGITINELLSGENLKKDEYQETFEKNIISVVDKVDKKNRIPNTLKKLALTIIFVIDAILIGYIMYANIEFTANFDKSTMSATIETTGLVTSSGTQKAQALKFNYSVYGIPKYLITENKNTKEKIIFITLKETLENRNDVKKNNPDNNVTDLTKKFTNSDTLELEPNTSYKIYYTKEPFKNISDASNKSLDKIIKKSYFLTEN